MIETFTQGLPAAIHHLAETLMREACERHLKLSVAESCTGGLIAAILTDVEGCAHAFERGFVAYTDEAKRELLGVEPRLLHAEGAVSARVAEAMAEGAIRGSDAALALSTTGFAGPGGPGDEPGLVFVGLATRSAGVLSRKYEFGNRSRAKVRIATIEAALELLASRLREPSS